MNRKLKLTAGVALGALMMAQAAYADPPSGTTWDLTFEDNFDGPLDTSIWKAWEGPRQISIAQAENAFTQNGNLVLRTDIDPTTGKTTIAQLYSRENSNYTFSQTYGYFEARMKLAIEPGQWAAFWMMPNPASQIFNIDDSGQDGAEIDIIEGYSPTHANFAAHFDGYSRRADGTHQGISLKAPTTPAQWHTYALEWSPFEYIWYVDDQVVARLDRNYYMPVTGLSQFDDQGNWVQVRNTPKTGEDFVSQIPQYLKLTTEANNGGFAGYIENADLPADSLVDWVRVWQYRDLPTGPSSPPPPPPSEPTVGFALEAEGTTYDNRLVVVQDANASENRAVAVSGNNSLGVARATITGESGSVPVTLTVSDPVGFQLVKLFVNGALHQTWNLLDDTGAYVDLTTDVAPFFEQGGTELAFKLFGNTRFDKFALATTGSAGPVTSPPPPPPPPSSDLDEIEAEEMSYRWFDLEDDVNSSLGRRLKVSPGQNLGVAWTSYAGVQAPVDIEIYLTDELNSDLVKVFRNGVVLENFFLTDDNSQPKTLTKRANLVPGDVITVKVFGPGTLDKVRFVR